MVGKRTPVRPDPPDEGVRWHVIRADLHNLLTRLPGLFRDDWTSILLVFANVYPVIDMAWKGSPIGSILIIYWFQMMILGFWNCLKLVIIARWWALAIVPLFGAMYLSIVNIFGFIAGGLLDDQMRGTEWLENFSLWTYFVPAALFFITHGLSFYWNFVVDGEYKKITWDAQIGKPFLRVMPMWLAALAGGVIGGFFNTAAVAALFVMPVKTALDVFGHFIEHGVLRLPEDPDVPIVADPDLR